MQILSPSFSLLFYPFNALSLISFFSTTLSGIHPLFFAHSPSCLTFSDAPAFSWHASPTLCVWLLNVYLSANCSITVYRAVMLRTQAKLMSLSRKRCLSKIDQSTHSPLYRYLLSPIWVFSQNLQNLWKRSSSSHFLDSSHFGLNCSSSMSAVLSRAWRMGPLHR